MPIKSFEVNSLEAKRYTKLGERVPQLRVDQNTAITSVTPATDKEAQLEFRFVISYVGVGVIKLEGRIVWEGDAKSLATQWADKRSLPNEVFGPVLGATYANCMPAAVTAARDIGLPPPLPPPKITQGMKPDAKASRGKDHKSSIEVA